MEPNLQRRIQRYGWDKAAGYYESCWQHPLAPAQKRLLEIADLKPGERVLDIACGTGLVSFPAATAVAPDGEVVGTDISDGMLETARRTAVERGLQDVSFNRMNAEALTFPESSFDVVLCALGLMYVPDPLQALREMYRVLAEDGRAIALVWGARRNCGWAEIFPIVDRRVQSDVCPLFFQLGTHDALQQAFLNAGFIDIALERFNLPLHFHSAEDACAAAFAGGPVALAYHRFDNRIREEVHMEYLNSIATYRSGSSYDVPGEFVMATGRKNKE